MFSCGGRADGGMYFLFHSPYLSPLHFNVKFMLTAKPDGLVTNSQLFPFTAGQTNILLAPENANNATCLVVNAAGKLDSTACSADVAGQSFSIV
jgi:hypothetical protein